MRLETTPLETRIHFSNMVIDMAQTLILRDGIDLVDTLKSFAPPASFITQPLETFVLLNRDVFKGSADLNIKTEGRQAYLTATLYQKGKEVLRFKTLIQQPVGTGLWHWARGTFQWGQLTITDPDLKTAITDYYRGANRPVPTDLQKSIETKTPFEALIRLDAPMPVSGLLKRF